MTLINHVTIIQYVVVVVQSLSCVVLFATPWTTAHQALLSSTISWICSNSCPFSEQCYLTISSSANPFSFCLQSFPSSGSFPMSQFFTLGGKYTSQNIGALASASVLPMNIQGWFPLGLISLISVQSKGLSRVFSRTPGRKYQFFSTQPSWWSNSHICTWLLKKP